VEAAGTALLVATVIGSGLMAERLTGDVALQLLTNAAATAAMLGVLIALLGPISGAHFNPAVSLVMSLGGWLRWQEAMPYVAAQCLGGLCGTLLAHAMFGESLLQLSTQVRDGVQLGLAEVVATFGLLVVILLGRQRNTLPVLVASYIGAAYWFTASTSFANPAVTIARMFTDSFAGIRSADVPMFLAGQAVGAGAAWFAIGWLLGKSQRPEVAPGPVQAADRT
jgi:glycerol uptake facilitator-like aquaporin